MEDRGFHIFKLTCYNPPIASGRYEGGVTLGFPAVAI